jgi:nodulation protein F
LRLPGFYTGTGFRVPSDSEIALPATDCGARWQLARRRARQREGMMDQLSQDVIDKIKPHADPELGEITPQTDLKDLGIHSLELTEIIFDLEEAYGIEIEMNTAEAWSKLSNVGDIIESVRGLIAKKG